MYTLKKEFRVETAHILDDSYMQECQMFHGHSAKIVVSICALGLNKAGMVMDFKLLKELFMPLYKTLDHHCLISEDKCSKVFRQAYDEIIPFGFVKVPFNPTAENIAAWLYNNFQKTLDEYRAAHPGELGNFYLNYIEYWETENACVRYDPNY